MAAGQPAAGDDDVEGTSSRRHGSRATRNEETSRHTPQGIDSAAVYPDVAHPGEGEEEGDGDDRSASEAAGTSCIEADEEASRAPTFYLRNASRVAARPGKPGLATFRCVDASPRSRHIFVRGCTRRTRGPGP